MSDPHSNPSADSDLTGRHISSWSFKQRIGRALWYLVQATIFKNSLHNAYRWRRFLLRCFGAKLAKNVRIRRTVRIEVPWNLSIGADTSVGDFAILYSLGLITLGRHVTISQYAHLCAGTHDPSTRAMTLIRLPITIGDDAWVAADAFVGPGVTIGHRTVVGARSSVFSNLPSDIIAGGNPARFLKARVLDLNPQRGTDGGAHDQPL